jgi:uncharacterized protein (DUF305 family)
MKIFFGLSALAFLVMAAPALAQDADLLAICLGEHAGHGMTDMDGMGAMDMPAEPPVDEAHQALMAGMDAMDSQMMAGMAAEDLDVAFICGMIPHHLGAISMAKAELQYGDDPWARELAQKIIEAQEAEIAAMREWLAKEAQ